MHSQVAAVGHPDFETYQLGVAKKEGAPLLATMCMSLDFAKANMRNLVSMWVLGVLNQSNRYIVWRQLPTITKVSVLDETCTIVWRCAIFDSKEQFLGSDLCAHIKEAYAR